MDTNDAGGAAGDDLVAEQLRRIRELFEEAQELFRSGEISLAVTVRNAAVRLHAELDRAVWGRARPAPPAPLETRTKGELP